MGSQKTGTEAISFIDELYKMTTYLQDLLRTVKEDIISEGFANQEVM